VVRPAFDDSAVLTTSDDCAPHAARKSRDRRIGLDAMTFSA